MFTCVCSFHFWVKMCLCLQKRPDHSNVTTKEKFDNSREKNGWETFESWAFFINIKKNVNIFFLKTHTSQNSFYIQQLSKSSDVRNTIQFLHKSLWGGLFKVLMWTYIANDWWVGWLIFNQMKSHLNGFRRNIVFPVSPFWKLKSF